MAPGLVSWEINCWLLWMSEVPIQLEQKKRQKSYSSKKWSANSVQLQWQINSWHEISSLTSTCLTHCHAKVQPVKEADRTPSLLRFWCLSPKRHQKMRWCHKARLYSLCWSTTSNHWPEQWVPPSFVASKLFGVLLDTKEHQNLVRLSRPINLFCEASVW